jgi:hypothetical protein
MSGPLVFYWMLFLLLTMLTIQVMLFFQVKVALYSLPRCCCPCLASSRAEDLDKLGEYKQFLAPENRIEFA